MEENKKRLSIQLDKGLIAHFRLYPGKTRYWFYWVRIYSTWKTMQKAVSFNTNGVVQKDVRGFHEGYEGIYKVNKTKQYKF